MYKIIRKSDGRIQRIAESSLIAKDIGPSAITDATDFYKQETAPYDVIYYIRTGELHLTIDGKSIHLGEGDVCIIDKNTEYELRGTARFILMKKPAFGSLF